MACTNHLYDEVIETTEMIPLFSLLWDSNLKARCFH
jgi:hypothetical protein